MIQALCPACGASIRFQSAVSITTVCSFCRAVLVRHDLDLAIIGRMAVLKEDASPLQIGSEGSYRGTAFRLIGRLQRRWDRGFWNEWFILFDDGRHGWLPEAQGFYAVLFERTTPALPSAPGELRPGSWIKIGNWDYEVADIKEALCSYTEGELPVQVKPDQITLCIDLAGGGDRCATLEFGAEGVRFYAGSHVDFDTFRFHSLRERDGWN
jgi:hypothetical protein